MKGKRKGRRYVSIDADLRKLMFVLMDCYARWRALIVCSRPCSFKEATMGSKLLSGGLDLFPTVMDNNYDIAQCVPDQPAVIYVSADGEYAGCAEVFRARQNRHVRGLAKYISIKGKAELPAYAEAVKKGCVADQVSMMPIQATTKKSKFTDEGQVIRLMNGGRNTSMGKSGLVGCLRRRVGGEEHRKRSGGKKTRSRYERMKAMREVLYGDSGVCQFVNEDSGEWATSVEMLSDNWCVGFKMKVKRRRYDHSNWEAVLKVYEGSVVIVEGKEYSLKMLQRMCRNRVKSGDLWGLGAEFVVEFKEVIQSVPDIRSRLQEERIISELLRLPRALRQVAIIRMQYAAEQIYGQYKSQVQLRSVRRVARRVGAVCVRREYRARCKYHDQMSMWAYGRRISSVVASMDLPADCAKFVRGRCRPSQSKAVQYLYPSYVNFVKINKSFTAVPWQHSKRCVSDEEAPRRVSVAPDGNSCVCFDPVQYPRLMAEHPPLRYSWKCIPFVFATTARKAAFDGLTEVAAELSRIKPVGLSESHIEQMAKKCVVSRKGDGACCSRIQNATVVQRYSKTWASIYDRSKVRASFGQSERRAAITVKDIEHTAKALAGDYVNVCDKNPGMVQILCHNLAWWLIKVQFDWETEGFCIVEDVMEAELLRAIHEEFPVSCSAIHPLEMKGSLAIAGGLFKYCPEYEKLKMRPYIQCHVERSAKAKSMCCRAAVFALNNTECLVKYSCHLSSVQGLRDKMNETECWFETLGAEMDFEPDCMDCSDDIEGFFNNCEAGSCIEDAKLCFELYRQQCGSRSLSSGFCWVSKCRGKPVLPGSTPRSRVDPSYTVVKWEAVIEMLEWSVKNRYFRLGSLIMEQKKGLFQGCSLSVFLALVTACVSEFKGSISDVELAVLVKGIRYVDDKHSQALCEQSSEDVKRAGGLIKKLNSFYNPSLNVKSVDSFAPGLHVYLGNLMAKESGVHWGLMSLVKNALYPLMIGQEVGCNQMYRSEHHYGSYQPRKVLRGQRIGRVLSVMRATDEKYQGLVLLCKYYEYRFMLGDPRRFIRSYLWTVKDEFGCPMFDALLRL